MDDYPIKRGQGILVSFLGCLNTLHRLAVKNCEKVTTEEEMTLAGQLVEAGIRTQKREL